MGSCDRHPADPHGAATTTRLPHVSPDGERIAFFADLEGDVQLFTVALNGTDVRQVTFGTKQKNIHPAWSPDGKSLHY